MTTRLTVLLALFFAIPLFAVPESKPQPKITMGQAKTIALRKEPGTITSSELEKEHGRWIYSFDIATAGGVHEVNVDANTGRVLEDSKETAAEEAKEAARKHQEHPQSPHDSSNPQ